MAEPHTGITVVIEEAKGVITSYRANSLSHARELAIEARREYPRGIVAYGMVELAWFLEEKA